ncbi:hypothetical protein L6452_36873 [Arctium lappa]|uniref:Uncharacterized protein n=1 Tax=Arctium lappa TaxID=4217 RepID=A0ACB8Y265_ARCLA|nr:hypothetical protein L6452_36873 [Arctium lappa]
MDTIVNINVTEMPVLNSTKKSRREDDTTNKGNAEDKGKRAIKELNGSMAMLAMKYKRHIKKVSFKRGELLFSRERVMLNVELEAERLSTNPLRLSTVRTCHMDFKLKLEDVASTFSSSVFEPLQVIYELNFAL